MQSYIAENVVIAESHTVIIGTESETLAKQSI